jgi:hypothetical protein
MTDRGAPLATLRVTNRGGEATARFAPDADTEFVRRANASRRPRSLAGAPVLSPEARALQVGQLTRRWLSAQSTPNAYRLGTCSAR